MSVLQIHDLPGDRMEGDVVAALFFEEERPLCGPAALLDWRLDGLLTGLIRNGRARGGASERVLVANNHKIETLWTLFHGGGSWRGLAPQSYRSLVRALLQACQEAGFVRVALCLTPLAEMDEADMEQLVRQALAELNGAPIDCLLSLGRTPHVL